MGVVCDHYPFFMHSSSVFCAFIVRSLSVLQAFTVCTPYVQHPFCGLAFPLQRNEREPFMTTTVVITYATQGEIVKIPHPARER